MSYFLFVDESGHDRKLAPAEVLGGFAIRDGALWSFVQAVLQLQVEMFGISYPQLNSIRRDQSKSSNKNSLEEPEWKEIKGENFLNTRVFKKASWFPAIHPDERRRLSEFCLRDGKNADRRSLSALAQAKLAYVKELFVLCRKFRGGPGDCRPIGCSWGSPRNRSAERLRLSFRTILLFRKRHTQRACRYYRV